MTIPKRYQLLQLQAEKLLLMFPCSMDGPILGSSVKRPLLCLQRFATSQT